MASATEIEQRNRYWFEHWREFTCYVVVSEPIERTGYVGGSLGHLFAAAPIPFNSQVTDRGTFEIHEDSTVWVYGSRRTYMWDLNNTHVVRYTNGVEMRAPNQPVILLLGPVVAPIAGCIVEHGGEVS